MDILDTALAGLAGADALPRDARRAAEILDWRPVFAGGGIDPVLAEGMLAAQAVGTYGCFAHDRLAVGLFMLAPGVAYPLHTHETEEVYLVLSGSVEIRHGIGGAPMRIGAGEHSVTPPHRLHALETREEHALMLYVWTGNLRCLNWWWSQEPGGGWTRTAWQRPVAGPWRPFRREPVDAAAMAEATGPAA